MKHIITGIAAIAMLSTACNNNTANSTKGECWAMQIRTNADIIKPEAFAPEDWKMNVDTVDNLKIVNTIVEAVRSGKQKAYTDIKDEKSVIAENDLKQLFEPRVDTMMVIDPANPDSYIPKVIKTEFTPASVDNLRFKEDWYFDKDKFSLTKKITAVGLSQSVYNEDGTFKGRKLLFWVKLN